MASWYLHNLLKRSVPDPNLPSSRVERVSGVIQWFDQWGDWNDNNAYVTVFPMCGCRRMVIFMRVHMNINYTAGDTVQAAIRTQEVCKRIRCLGALWSGVKLWGYPISMAEHWWIPHSMGVGEGNVKDRFWLPEWMGSRVVEYIISFVLRISL